jgi:phytoene synthase
MSDQEASAFASFEEKWLAANPEQATVALFLAPGARLRASAFGCLIHELEQAAFGLREAHVAEVKIQWWRQELLAASSGRPRHPVSAVLFSDPAAATIDAAAWESLVDGALAMMQVGAASDIEALLAGYAPLYVPVARVEAALFDAPAGQAPAAARLWTVSHLLQALRHLPDAGERLPVPLDVLARHESTRGALSEPGAKRDDLLRDLLGRLAGATAAALGESPLAPLARRVRGRLDLALMQTAQRSGEPLRALLSQPGAARWKALWWSWREARRLANAS